MRQIGPSKWGSLRLANRTPAQNPEWGRGGASAHAIDWPDFACGARAANLAMTAKNNLAARSSFFSLLFFFPREAPSSSTLRFYATNGEPAQAVLSNWHMRNSENQLCSSPSICALGRLDGLRALPATAWRDLASVTGIRKAGPGGPSRVFTHASRSSPGSSGRAVTKLVANT